MRWALVKVCLAVTAMVVVAFAVPLGLVVQEMASDRAFSNAERQAATIGPTLSITTDPVQLRKAVESTQMGAARRMAVHVPAIGDSPRVSIGEGRAGERAVAETRRMGRAYDGLGVGGRLGAAPADRARVRGHRRGGDLRPGERGQQRGRDRLAGARGRRPALIVGSVGVADRLGARLVRPAERLADAAHQLGEGRPAPGCPRTGPKELRSAAVAFNAMADQVVELLANERELAADLSHRLRTPLTVLRLNTASLGDGPAAEQTRAAVEQLEREVDTIIRTAREQRPATGLVGAGAGCDASEVIRDRMAFWSALAEDEGREVRLAGVDRTVRIPVARPELAAALDAMLGNVFRHTPEGTPFAVDVHDAGDAVIVLVSTRVPASPTRTRPCAAATTVAATGHGPRPGHRAPGRGVDRRRRTAGALGARRYGGPGLDRPGRPEPRRPRRGADRARPARQPT
ncbi:two-component sensor histidine kinase [Streptomyces avidinii]